MERLAFETDAGAPDRGRARTAPLAIAGVLIGLTVAALAAAEHTTRREGAAPARAAFDEPPLGRPGRRY